MSRVYHLGYPGAGLGAQHWTGNAQPRLHFALPLVTLMMEQPPLVLEVLGGFGFELDTSQLLIQMDGSQSCLPGSTLSQNAANDWFTMSVLI